ncbi:TetR/AcrR family transcriptional regulator [Streptococcus saliviloxodontae]|uniref:AcrR family transcriptional regulator n=1 Tax=Streptococcus saliviloxodontae TaxID=1349416 RepID=A0ABS2PNG2_9STRE|nr:TetR/AcrR family transcriptional regulator [Streptococcus saliviloxodontae]MBM7636827.1 AcrR family transcriptional regulator [Streptococcus saliviloxodontae]
MAKISKEESLRRRDEIIDSCERLYQHRDLKDITINEIGKELSFSRTAVYSYFNNKEEIIISLLEREYSKWIQELEKLKQLKLSKEEFAEVIASSLDNRSILLKILAIDMESLDAASRMEILVSFKRCYGKTLRTFQEALHYQFSDLSPEKVSQITFAFFPFLYGVYPYVKVTDKQKEAMAQAQVPYVYLSQHALIKQTLEQLL